MSFSSLVTLGFDLDLQTRPSEGPTIFHLNIAQIRSAVPEILHTNKKVTDYAKNRTLCSSLHVVTAWKSS